MIHRAGRCLPLFGAVIILALGASITNAELITFDDLGTSSVGGLISNGYAGFNLYNFYYVTGSLVTPSGYPNSVVSPGNVAVNGHLGSSATFYGGPFTVNSLYLTGAWNDGLNVTLTGYNGGTQLDTTTVVVNTSGPTLVTLNWTNLTALDFASFGGTENPAYVGYGGGPEFAMDNLLVNSAVAPEPATLTLLGSGFLAFGGLRFYRRRRTTSTT